MHQNLCVSSILCREGEKQNGTELEEKGVYQKERIFGLGIFSLVCIVWGFFCGFFFLFVFSFSFYISVIYNLYTLKIQSGYTEWCSISKDILGELAAVTELFALLCVKKDSILPRELHSRTETERENFS